MRKFVLKMVIVPLTVLCLVWGLALAMEGEMVVPMGEITLEPLASEAKRSAVSFPHATHFDYSCQSCHHTWTGEAPIVGCGTTDCHDLAELPKNEDGTPTKDPVLKARYYKNAYHDMCIGCHKAIKKQNKALEAQTLPGNEKMMAGGPTGCIECHPKE